MSSTAPDVTPRVGPPLPHPPADSSASSMQPVAPNVKINLQSCQFCRKRKIKCDKVDGGCSPCSRAQNECVYPASQRKGRPRKPGTPRSAPAPTPREALLLKKLWKLERVVDDLTTKGGLPPPVPTDVDHLHHAGTDEPPRDQLGRLFLGKHYMNDSFWSTQLKNVLEESDEESNDDDEDGTPFTVPPPDSSEPFQANFIFAFGQQPTNLTSLHPPSSQVQTYWKLYHENCEVVLRLCHSPTTREIFGQAESDVESLGRGHEALMFSIYFATITSMTREEVAITFGADKTVLLSQYEHAVRGALVNAGFLNSQDLSVLQAFVLYLICIRHTDGAAVWTMTGLALRIAHGMGLDRDGELFKLPPLRVELRRRIWHQLSLLDLRSSEARGTFAAYLTYDTKLPTNINDSDLGADSQSYPRPRVGMTDMTIALARVEVCQLTRRLHRTNSLAIKEKLIEEFEQHEETTYLRYCESGSRLQHWARNLVRLVTKRMKLMLFRREEDLPRSARERLFFTSVEVIDLSNKLRRDDYAKRWHWLVRTYMQWHAMAAVLSELAEQPRTPTTERAWKVIEASGPKWEIPEDSPGKILSQSVKKLLAKAQAHRASQEDVPIPLSVDAHNEDEEPLQNQPLFSSHVPFHPPAIEDTYPGSSHFAPVTDAIQQGFTMAPDLTAEEMSQPGWYYGNEMQGLDHSSLASHGQYWNGWDPIKDFSIHGGTN